MNVIGVLDRALANPLANVLVTTALGALLAWLIPSRLASPVSTPDSPRYEVIVREYHAPVSEKAARQTTSVDWTPCLFAVGLVLLSLFAWRHHRVGVNIAIFSVAGLETGSCLILYALGRRIAGATVLPRWLGIAASAWFCYAIVIAIGLQTGFLGPSWYQSEVSDEHAKQASSAGSVVLSQSIGIAFFCLACIGAAMVLFTAFSRLAVASRWRGQRFWRWTDRRSREILGRRATAAILAPLFLLCCGFAFALCTGWLHGIAPSVT